MSLQMEFDFDAAIPVAGAALPDGGRAARSAVSYRAGLSAEAQVAADYAARGYPLIAQRWRGRCGEIDLVLRNGSGIVFVEVKKSGSFDRALAALSPRQVERLWHAAEEFVGAMPDGALTELRFDVALLDGFGAIRIMENAFAH